MRFCRSDSVAYAEVAMHDKDKSKRALKHSKDIPRPIQSAMFGQRESSRGLAIDKQRNISNMGLFAIV